MAPKSPRIRRNDLSSKGNEDSPRCKTNSPRAPYNKTLLGSQLKKRRSQKKSIGNKDKFQMLKAPKPILLTPSSSDVSLSNSVTNALQCKQATQLAPQSQSQSQSQSTPAALPPYLTLKRQQSAAMLNFRARKSLSQMDFKEARRTGNYQLVAHVPSTKALVPTGKQQKGQDSQLTIKDESLTQLLLQDAAQLCSTRQGNVRFVVNGDQDVRIASLRIFNTIMLRSWRRRRQEVRHLSEQVEDFKRNFVKNRNQLHVYNTLFALEKRRNDTLNDQLKQSYMDSAKTKLSYNELNLLLAQISEEKVKLLEENVSKHTENENLQELLHSTKKELFQANAQQREQLEQLTRVQLECQNAKFDIEELTTQLKELREELTKKLQELLLLHDKNFAAELVISKLKAYSQELEQGIKQKEEQVVTLQNCLAATVGQRIRQCFAQSQAYQHATFRLMHFVAFCMLPGTPPPALPMSNAVKKIKHMFQGGKRC